MGLARGCKKMDCTLVPFSLQVDKPVTELQLLFFDVPLLTHTDKVWVTERRSEACGSGQPCSSSFGSHVVCLPV